MVAKELAKTVISALPEDASLDDIMHALYIRAKFEHGEQEIRAGRGISHEEVKRRLQKWAG